MDLSFTKARQYFLESENYCNMSLPKYIEFGDILSFVQKQVKNKELEDILAKPKVMPSSFEGVNYRILKKKGCYVFLSFYAIGESFSLLFVG